MSRKISAIILSVLLCGVFVLSDFQAADAATPDRLEMLKRDRIKYGQQLQRSADKPDEVLVIFEESASLSDTDAGKIKSLEEGDVLDGSIEVEDVWEFEDDGVKVALASSDELSTDVMIKKAGTMLRLRRLTTQGGYALLMIRITGCSGDSPETAGALIRETEFL